MDPKETQLVQLRKARRDLLWKMEGLSECDARRPLTPTGTNLLGLVKHCMLVEHGYLVECLGRQSGIDLPETGDDPHADLYATADESVAQIVGLYGQVGDVVDATIAELDLDSPSVAPLVGRLRRDDARSAPDARAG